MDAYTCVHVYCVVYDSVICRNISTCSLLAFCAYYRIEQMFFVHNTRMNGVFTWHYRHFTLLVMCVVYTIHQHQTCSPNNRIKYWVTWLGGIEIGMCFLHARATTTMTTMVDKLFAFHCCHSAYVCVCVWECVCVFPFNGNVACLVRIFFCLYLIYLF